MVDKLVLFATAKLAKEKGFLELVDYTYCTIGKWCGKLSSNKIDSNDPHSPVQRPINYNSTKHDNGHISAPTQSLLQKWLRDEHGIHIQVRPVSLKRYKRNCKYKFRVSGILETKSLYNTYEEGLEKGLIEALKLIEYDRRTEEPLY